MILTNFTMGGMIALLITAMAAVKSNRLKALIYSLPLPITAALIATQSPIDASHIIGLVLLCLFLWGVFYLHEKRELPIILADILSAGSYLILGFVLAKSLKIGFWPAVLGYFLSWIVYVREYSPIEQEGEKDHFHPLTKGIIVFPTASALLFLKSLLKGIVVTFPFSGVFAVIETKKTLYTLAGEFTNNSLAILVFLVTIKMGTKFLGYYPAIGVGWLSYIPTIFLLQKIKRT